MARVLAILFVFHSFGVSYLAQAQEKLSREQKELMELLKDDLEQRPRVKFRKPTDIKPDLPSKFQKQMPSDVNKRLLRQIQDEKKRRRSKFTPPAKNDDWYDEENYDSTSKMRVGTQEKRAREAFRGIYDGDRRYGKLRFGLGVAKFTFADELTASVSDRLYGEANVYPKFDFDYTPFEWIVGIAAHLSVGLHRQSGIGAEKNSTAQSIQDDPSGSETTRKFYPLQLGVSARIPVLPKKLVVLDGKLAYEYLIAREVREDGVASSDDSYVTKASKSGVTFGLGASICLNGLSQKAVSAMRNSINIGYVYLRGYYEVSAQLDTSQGADFSRNTFGVSIVAETF